MKTTTDAALLATFTLREDNQQDIRIPVYVGSNLANNYLQFDNVPDVLLTPCHEETTTDRVATYVLDSCSYSQEKGIFEAIYKRQTVVFINR
jgi:hypothetical protein